MFRNPKKRRNDIKIAQDVAALLRNGALIAVRRADGEIGFVTADRATPDQRANALDPATVVASAGLFDPTVN